MGGALITESPRVEALKNELEKDKTLSDLTKNEIAGQLKEFGLGKIDEAEATFKKAKEGVDTKFKTRQLAKQQAELRADQPGILRSRR